MLLMAPTTHQRRGGSDHDWATRHRLSGWRVCSVPPADSEGGYGLLLVYSSVAVPALLDEAPSARRAALTS